MRCRFMTLAASVVGEKHVAGIRRDACAIAKSDVDAAGERDDPALPRCAMKVDDMRCEAVAEQHRFSSACDIEVFGSFARVQRLEMGLTVTAGIESIKFHRASG